LHHQNVKLVLIFPLFFSYYDAFPALIDKDGTETLPAPKEKTNTTVWNKKNAKLSPGTSDVERTTPSELSQSRPASNPQFRRSQSRGSSGESDDSQKARKSRCRSSDLGTASTGFDQHRPDHEVKNYDSKSAESTRNYRSQQRSHSQRYRSRSQEKFSGGRNKHTPRPYVFYKLKSNRDPKGQFGKDAHPPGRNRTRQSGASFFTPRYPVSPAKLGKAPKFPDSLKITDDILRLLHVRPEQEQWFDDLVSGNFPRHPIRVGHHPRRPNDENEDDLFLYEGPIETVFPPSETRQGRLYERHSCSSVDDLVMAPDVTDTVTTVDATDNHKSSRFLPFILNQDQDDDFYDIDIHLSLAMIEKDSGGAKKEETPPQDESCNQLEKELDAVVPEVVRTESSDDQQCKMDWNVWDLDDVCRMSVMSPCGSENTLKTSSSSDSESTEEDEYDFSRFTDFIENKKKGLNEKESCSDGMNGKSRSEKLALQIDGAQSRGISLLRELQPENSDWLRGDEESSGSENERQRSPNLAKDCAEQSLESEDLVSGANEQIHNLAADEDASFPTVKSEDLSGDVRAGLDFEQEVKEFSDINTKEEIETVLLEKVADVESGESSEAAAEIVEMHRIKTNQTDTGIESDETPAISKNEPGVTNTEGIGDGITDEPANPVMDMKKVHVEMQDGLEDIFEKIGIFGKAIESIHGEIKKIEDVNIATDATKKFEMLKLHSEDEGPSDLPALIHPNEKNGKVSKSELVRNLRVEASSSNILQASTQDTGLLSPNRSRLDGFPALLPKEEDDAVAGPGDENDLRIGASMVDIDLQAEDGFAKLQDLPMFLDFRVEDIKELLPQEESPVVTSEDTPAKDLNAVGLLPKCKSSDSPKPYIPQYLSDNKQNESVGLSQTKSDGVDSDDDGDDNVRMQIFTVPASHVQELEGMYLTKDDVLVRVINNDSSDDDSSDTGSTSTTTGSDGYSEILGDLDSVLAGLNISSEEITADMAENSAQFLEDLKLLDDSLDASISTDENSGSDIVSCGDAWVVSEEVANQSMQVPNNQTEPVHPGLHRSFSERSDHGILYQPDQEQGGSVIGCDSTWAVSDDDTIQTKQYKQLNNNQKDQTVHPGLQHSLSNLSDQGHLPSTVHCSSDVMGHGDTWTVTEDDTIQSNNNQEFVFSSGLHRSLSDRSDHGLCSSDVMIHDDTWTVSEDDALQSKQLNNNQEMLPVLHSGLHPSLSNRSDHGLLPAVINLGSNLTDTEITVQDHDKTADSGISHYAEENCEMAENIALATCGNLSSDGESSSETSESPFFDSPEATPLAKHIAAITRRRHPGVGKKWPPTSSTKDAQDDGYGEGQIWPEQDNTKNTLQVDNESWNTSRISQNAYLGSPRNPDQANWGSVSESTGSGPASEDHSPWPTLDNMFTTDNNDWQDRSTPGFSSTSSHGMRKVDADWQTLQISTSESAGFGEPLYVNINDTSLDNNSDTLYFLPSLSDSPKVEEFLAEASNMLDGMDHERFHQLLIEIENQSENDAENMGDFSEALQKLAVNEGNYAVLQELNKLFQTYIHADDLPDDDDDDKLLMDAVDDLAQFLEHDPNRCMSPGGEEYSGQDDQYIMKRAVPGNVGQGDPTYNLWKDSGKQFSGHLNWYIGGEDPAGNISKGHSCSDIAYWSDTDTVDDKPESGIHTSASYGQLSSLTRKRSRHHHSTTGPYFGLPHSQSANLQPSEFSAFRDKIPQRMSHVRSEPHLASRKHRALSNFKSDSDLLNKTAPIITLQKETKATIGEGYNKKQSTDAGDVVISPKTHFRPIQALSLENEQSGYNANAATITGGVQAAVGTSIQHVEKPPLFPFSPENDEDYQLFVTSDSDNEASFVPKFKVNLDGGKWSQTDQLPTGRAVGDGKLKSGSFTDECMETCRKKLEQCSQEILLQCKKHLKSQLTDVIFEEEDLNGVKEEDSVASSETAEEGNVATNEIIICDLNGNIGDTCTEQTDVAQKCEGADVVLSCHDRDCFCPECGIERQVATPEPYWLSGKGFYACSGLGMDKKIVENRDGESLQGGSIELGKIVDKIFNVDKNESKMEEEKSVQEDTDEACSGNVDNGHVLDFKRHEEGEDLDVMALCNTVGEESSQDSLSNTCDNMEKPVISAEGDCGLTPPQVPVQDVSEIWAAGTDLLMKTDESVIKKYSLWSGGGDVGLPSLPAGVPDDLDKIIPGCLLSGANNTLKEKPCSEDGKSDEAKKEPFIIMEDEAFSLDQPSVSSFMSTIFTKKLKTSTKLLNYLHFWLACGEPIQSRSVRRRPLAGHVS
jgi:hypothetical protein